MMNVFCSPESLLEQAKAETHPLHKHFEWDDDIAADKYRQQQDEAA